MSGGVLQQLLGAGEYDEFDDIILVEGEFVEFDSTGFALRQVILGISPFHFIKAGRTVTDYKANPDIYYNTDTDPYLDGLEIISIVPICLLSANCSRSIYEIEVVIQGEYRFYLLCNTRLNGQLEDTWSRWVERVRYIRDDPYHYIRDMFDEHGLPYPDNFTQLQLQETLQRNTNEIPDVYIDETVVAGNSLGNKGVHIEEEIEERLVNGEICPVENTPDNRRSGKKKRRRRSKKTFSWKFMYLKRKR